MKHFLSFLLAMVVLGLLLFFGLWLLVILLPVIFLVVLIGLFAGRRPTRVVRVHYAPDPEPDRPDVAFDDTAIDVAAVEVEPEAPALEEKTD